jgi:hypothetical protein
MEAIRRVADGIDAKAATIAGLAAGAAFVATMEIDLRATGRNVDDRILLGRPVVKNPDAAKAVGTILHGVNSVAFAWLYAAVCDRIPGPPWWKGVLFFNVENVLLYPLTAFERFHPAVREGRLASYWNWPAFLQSIPRHVAYGVVLGVVYDRLRRR